MSESSAKPILRATGLQLGYEGKAKTLRNIGGALDLALNVGEFVCLLGPNGSGKSTLIRTLAGMQKALAGSISISGTEIAALSPKQRARSVSVVLTESLPGGMFDAYSVVALGRHPHTSWTGTLSAHDKQRISWALDAAGASDLARRQVSELSDGERQKVMIARALAQECKLLLLDEPTAFLDLPRRVELMKTLRDLARNEGLAIALSTHDLDLALRSADRLWLWDQNETLLQGMPEELALDGKIASSFRSGEVKWDSEHGFFRMHCETCATVELKGAGAARAWTGRALSRIGYEILPEGVPGNIHIEVSEGDKDIEWILSAPQTSKRFGRMYELIEYLKGPVR